MAIRAERLDEIPDEMVDKIVRSFEKDGALKIIKERGKNGWTVTAEFDMAEQQKKRMAAQKIPRTS